MSVYPGGKGADGCLCHTCAHIFGQVQTEEGEEEEEIAAVEGLRGCLLFERVSFQCFVSSRRTSIHVQYHCIDARGITTHSSETYFRFDFVSFRASFQLF